MKVTARNTHTRMPAPEPYCSCNKQRFHLERIGCLRMPAPLARPARAQPPLPPSLSVPPQQIPESVTVLGATLDLGPLRRLVEPINNGLEVHACGGTGGRGS